MISKRFMVKDSKGNETGVTVGCFGSAPEGFLEDLEELVRDIYSREPAREDWLEAWLEKYFVPMD